MVNLRYHIATIVAIFLALGIGIFIGIVGISDGVLIKGQEQIITLLEKEFEDIRSQNYDLKVAVSELENELGEYHKFGEWVFPIISQGKLSGKNIGIITTNPDVDARTLAGELVAAGAGIAFTISLGHEFYHPGQDGDIVDSVFTLIETGGGDDGQQYLEKFRSQGNLGTDLDWMILIGGNLGENSAYVRTIDYPLLQSLIEKGIKVVGLEKESVEFSYLPVYEELGVPTIKDYDSIFGKLTLINLLNEE
jgi:hypothetical protein